MPDEDIFPHATGAAEMTVAAHEAACDLVYHGSWFCPFVQVHHLFLAATLAYTSPVDATQISQACQYCDLFCVFLQRSEDG